MGLFKRAAARGVAYELVRQGVCAFPSKTAMDEAADAVADAQPAMPEMSPEGGHSPEELAQVANKLMEIAHALMEQAGAAGGAPPEGAPPGAEPTPPPDPEAAKAAAYLSKTASEADPESVAVNEAVACMEKAAGETKQSGALIHGGDKGNSFDQAARDGEVAALDKKNRPEGAYHHGQGKTELDTIQSLVGDMSKAKGPANTPSGSNSLTEDVGKKHGSLDAELKKIANKLVGLHEGKSQNKLTDAAKYDQIAALDNKNRPEGTYHVGQGHTNFSESQDARIGVEIKHPKAPSNSPAGTNSVIQASQASHASKTSSEEDAFVLLFKKTAEDVGAYLPGSLSEDEKVAAISKMIGFDRDQRQSYITELHTEKAASEAKPAKYKKEPEAKEEAGKKESALLGRIREIAASAS